jgi:hypothetical protein
MPICGAASPRPGASYLAKHILGERDQLAVDVVDSRRNLLQDGVTKDPDRALLGWDVRLLSHCV